MTSLDRHLEGISNHLMWSSIFQTPDGGSPKIFISLCHFGLWYHTFQI